MKILKKATSLLLASIMFLTAGVTAFADDYYDEETEKESRKGGKANAARQVLVR